MVNTDLLETKIQSSGKKKLYLAQKCNLSPAGFRNCCINKSEFTLSQANVLSGELGINDWAEFTTVFFAH